MKLKLLLSSLLLLLVSCSANGPVFTESPAPRGKAKLVVYRVPSTPMGRAAQVYIDGNLLGTMKNKGYLSTLLSSGSHEVNIKFPQSASFADISDGIQRFNASNGGTLYFRYDTIPNYTGGSIADIPVGTGTLTLPDYTMIGILEPVDSIEALSQLRSYKEGDLMSQ